jgi:hypothetical protein
MKRIALTSFAVLGLVLGGPGEGFTLAQEKNHNHGSVLEACAKSCADCMNSCASCYRHCAALVGEGKQDHRKSMDLCNDCAEVCSTAAKLASRHSGLSALVCETCAKACDECDAACSKFSDDKHMTECAKACRDCAAACRDMVKHASG